MAKTDEYRQIIRDILTEYSQIKSANEEVEAELIFDLERDSPVGDALRTISTSSCRLVAQTQNLWLCFTLRY